MNNLKDIHNATWANKIFRTLFYQDINEQFEGYTQPAWKDSKVRIVVLSGYQWTIWRIYTTCNANWISNHLLFYQDINEQFEGYTQLHWWPLQEFSRCFIRISMNNLKDIHNRLHLWYGFVIVVLSGYQWTIWRIYTTSCVLMHPVALLFYQDINEQFEGYTQPNTTKKECIKRCFIRISMNNLKDIHN